MVRQVQIVIPTERTLEIKNVLKSRLYVHHLQVFNGEDVSMIMCKVVEKKISDLMDTLLHYGVGTDEKKGTIDVLPLSSTKPRVSTWRNRSGKKKRYAVDDRMSYDEIHDLVDSQIHLTFDYLALIIVGALIAGVGLITDNAVAVVASMLVSPLLGPMLGMTFGAIVLDWKMFWKSFRNETYGLALCWFTGFVFGLCASFALSEDHDAVMDPKSEMGSRGMASSLIPGALIAIPSGCGVALGITSNAINPLVGVAISAALLPPIVNSGLAVAMGIMIYITQQYDQSVHQMHFTVGLYSFLLFMVNWVLVVIFGYLMFKVKKIRQGQEHPGENKEVEFMDEEK